MGRTGRVMGDEASRGTVVTPFIHSRLTVVCEKV